MSYYSPFTKFLIFVYIIDGGNLLCYNIDNISIGGAEIKKYLKYILCLAVVLIAGIITCSCQSKYGVCVEYESDTVYMNDKMAFEIFFDFGVSWICIPYLLLPYIAFIGRHLLFITGVKMMKPHKMIFR